MTAHPKKDPVTGEMVFFGYDLSKKPHVSVATISKDGQLHSTVHFNQLEEPKMMHDFAITTHYIIIPDFSYVFTPKNAGPNLFTSKPQKPIFEFDTSKPARIGLFRRGKQDEKEVRWFEIKPAIFFHSYNAWEEEDASTGDKHVKFIACRLEDGTMDFNDVEKTRSQLYEWDLNLTTSAVKEGPVMCKWTDSGEIKSAAIDFPVLSEHRVGQKSDIGYFTFSTVNFTREGRGGFALIDFSTKPYPTLTPKYLPNGHYSSELSFVNRKGSKKEGDGYLVFISSSVDADAEFWVLNAKTLGEVYRVKIPEKVPMGFHGHWTPS